MTPVQSHDAQLFVHSSMIGRGGILSLLKSQLPYVAGSNWYIIYRSENVFRGSHAMKLMTSLVYLLCTCADDSVTKSARNWRLLQRY